MTRPPGREAAGRRPTTRAGHAHGAEGGYAAECHPAEHRTEQEP